MLEKIMNGILNIHALTLENLFMQLGLILIITFVISLVMRLLKQPLVVGYIFSGLIVGPLFLNLIGKNNTLLTFSNIGVAFLLFLVGLQLSPKILKQVGPISLITGFGQIIFTVGLGYLISLFLGFDKLVSLFISLAITFSSTIIVMKLLSDKDDMDKLYGKISMGLALVQNLVAILLLIIISSFSKGDNLGNAILSTFIMGGILILFLIPISYFILPKLSLFFAKSSETLFLFSISWVLGLSILFELFGFSIEIGALFAGIMLSISPYGYEISSKLKPLRDFFILIFFIMLGSQIIFVQDLIIPALILSVFILLGNPFIVIVIMGLMGYSKRTGFMTGLTVAQISEFSLIFITLVAGSYLIPAEISKEIISFITIIALITMAGSTYMILYSDYLYEKFKKILGFFEKKKVKDIELSKEEYDSLLLGYNRIGFSIVKSFSKITKNFLIVDYDPIIIKNIKNKGLNAIYGDVDNFDFLEELQIHKAKLIVSTIPDKQTNLLILDVLKKKSNTIVILTARQIEDAVDLYKAKADYVILPHFLGGEYISNLIKKYKYDKVKYQIEKQKELETLNERLNEGHEHPKIEKEK